MRRHHRGESGAVLIMTAILLVVFLGVAALVVDLGGSYENRRKMQNAADASALGAAQDLPTLSGSTSAAVTDAETIGKQNLPSLALNWDACPGDTLPVGFTLAPSNNCISFSFNNGLQIRVRVPYKSSPSIFSGILGFHGITTSATAIAQVHNLSQNNVLPFALFSGVGSGETCVKTNPNGPNPCVAPLTGNFNVLDVAEFSTDGVSDPNRPLCRNQENVRLQENVAMGVDHPLTPYTNGVEIDDACFNVGPNTLWQSTGNKASAIDLGLVHGTASDFPDNQPAHLQRGIGPFTTVDNAPLDNVGIWNYIDPNLATSLVDKSEAPPSCAPSEFTSVLALPTNAQKDAMHAAVALCINDYASGGYTGPVFTKNTTSDSPIDLLDIQHSPRMAYLPRFIQSAPCGNSFCLQITGFQAVFFQRLYSGCSSNICSTDFEPGPWNTAPQGQSNDTVNAFTAWVLPATMLPGHLGDTPTDIGGNSIVQLVG